MEPLNDHELNELLREWQAPPAPAGLKPPKEPRSSWWRWLLNGTVRVPVPAGILTVVILALSVYWAVTARQVVEKPPQTVRFADFQPVKQLQPRIIRSGYESQ
jgi:hypothetical protein